MQKGMIPKRTKNLTLVACFLIVILVLVMLTATAYRVNNNDDGVFLRKARERVDSLSLEAPKPRKPII